MRAINISNQKQRNAQVGFELNSTPNSVTMRHCTGQEIRNARFLKASAMTTFQSLIDRYEPDLTDRIIERDDEIDMEHVGMSLMGVKKVFVSQDGKVACRANRQLVYFNPQGEEIKCEKYHTTVANINLDVPLRWTGKFIPKAKAARMFVFAHKYQIRHINGITFDFLYDMARQLHETDSLMLLGAGSKGLGPLVMSGGGVPYRAFLEGRVDGESYMLILHLTNLEIKSII